jgi:mannose-6-phosphate isomerase
LHLVTLAPGQALFLPSGKLHAYLKGVSIEVMANSDNVLRGGLTPKHVDIDELLNVLDFQPVPLKVLTPEPIRYDMKRYPSEADEFELATIDIEGSTGYDSGQRPIAPEILLCTVGKVEMCWGNSENVMQLSKGESVIVPAQVDQYALTGHGTIYKAGLNHRLFGLES